MGATLRSLAFLFALGWATGCCCTPDLGEWYSDGRDAWENERADKAEPTKEVSPSDSMTPEQAAETLDYMNEFCGDTLCEGEHDYRFDELECADRHCTLHFRARRYDAKKWRREEIVFDVDGSVYDEYGSSTEFARASSAALDAWAAAQGS